MAYQVPQENQDHDHLGEAPASIFNFLAYLLCYYFKWIFFNISVIRFSSCLSIIFGVIEILVRISVVFDVIFIRSNDSFFLAG